MFTKDSYIKRRETLRTKISSGIALILGNDESAMNYADNTYHFKQDSTFLYYFGLNQPGLVGIIDLDNNKDIIFGNDLSIDEIVWMGHHPTINDLANKVGINTTLETSSIKKFLDDSIKNGRKLHILPPYRPEHQIKLFSWLNAKPNEQSKYISVALITAISTQRNIKSIEEIEEIEKAVNTTVDMHLAAMRYARPGINEAQVAAKVHEVALAAGGNLSFPIIATIHGETLHNHYHGNTLKSGNMFLLDAGAETSLGYAGDMSSTFPVDKTFTSVQKDIYQVALNAHEAAIAALKPGVKFKDVHLKAAKTIVEGMSELGFMKGNAHDAVTEGAHALFFPCGLGHFMGLDVHDMENYGEKYVGYAGEEKSTQFGLKSLRLGRELLPGNVLTIEPGIYFIPQLIELWKSQNKFTDFINYDKVEKFKDFGGCRNEEDILITNDSYRILGKALPKTIKDVENERLKAF
ncbi:MAG: aminopeptidase P family protein [Bacteroidales bacterium]|jgi:Xaa-Pro aminopeptidase|nr:aminopeptidase P family protein [Bacteroidales bacterium]